MDYHHYTNPELGFELQYPIDWIVDENPGFPAIIFAEVVRYGETQSKAIFSVFVTPFKRPESQFTDYSKGTMERLRTTVSQFKVVDKLRKNRELGMPTYDVSFQGYQGPHHVRCRSMWALKNKNIYSLNSACDIERYKEIMPIFEQMKSSIKIFTPRRATPKVQRQRQKDDMLARMDYVRLEQDVEKLDAKSEKEEIHNIIEAFSLASIMADLKGFGPLNFLYPKFRQKLIDSDLMDKLGEDLEWTLNMFDDLTKKQNLI
jgi:hypothetical protein